LSEKPPARAHRIRVDGVEYGPFPEKKLRAWISHRPPGPEDVWLDEESATWRPLAEWIESAPVQETDIFAGLTVPSMYRRITLAGFFLILLWGLVFAGIRLWTGKWPGQGAPPHRNPHQWSVDTGP
jgi:hypothetical protein